MATDTTASLTCQSWHYSSVHFGNLPEHVNEKVKIRNKLVDYFDRKLTQQFIGTQLIKLMQEYCDEALRDLPEHVKEEAKIRNINKR